MKKLFAIATLGLLSLSVTGCGTRMGFYPDADKYVVGNQNYEAEVQTIDIDWISGKVILVEDDTIEGIKVEEETNTTIPQEQVHSYLNEGTLFIKYFASGYMHRGFSVIKKELTVTYKPGISKINIDLTSGSLTAEKITSQEVNLDMTSGNAKIGEMVADKVDTDLTSGEIEITKLNAKELDSDMTSGTFTVGFSAIEKAHFDLTSGKINMTLPEDGGKVKVSKTSGSVKTERECTISDNVYTFGTGEADIRVSVTSGTLKIA